MKDDPILWSDAFAGIAWRLHVPAAVPDLLARAQSPKLSTAQRRQALDTLAFVMDPAASKAMLTLAAPDSSLREPATFWLLNRSSNDWTDYGLMPALKTAGIYDPETIVLKEVVVPKPAADLPELSVEAIVGLTGNAARGKETAARGPEVYLAGWAPLLLFSGNLGALTSGLWDRPEAEIFADVAAEMVTFTRNNIMLQAGTAMLAQANQAPQQVLALLR